ncbi:FolC bifunctional protein, partial [Aureobasidium melanogenum]
MYTGANSSQLERPPGLKIFHVAGTKGKGSTSMFLAQLLHKLWNPSEKGTKIGLYTSPHLVFVRERIQINGELISEDMFAHYFFELWKEPCKKLSYAGFLTLLALHKFVKEGVNAAVIEAVVGGRYDSTNIINSPTAVGITPIGLDHIKTLGPTIKDIAGQKAGVFKRNVPAFSAYQKTEVEDVLNDIAHHEQVSLLRYVDINSSLKCSDDMPAALRANASLAYAMFRVLVEPQDAYPEDMPEKVVQVIQQTSTPGRFERISKENRVFLLDGAHTPESIEIASEWALQQFSAKGYKALIFNQSTRDTRPLLEAIYSRLASVLQLVVFCSSKVHNESTDEVEDILNKNEDPVSRQTGLFQENAKSIWYSLGGHGDVQTCDSMVEAIDVVASVSGGQSQQEQVEVFITGSLHLIGGVRHILTSVSQRRFAPW